MTRKIRKKDSGPSASTKSEGKAGTISGVANTEVSRRTLLKGTAAAAAVVGVSAVGMKGVRLGRLEQSSSTTTYTTISPTATNTAVVPPPAPIVATSPFGQRTITLNVNGTNHNVIVEPRSMLADVLRDSLGLIATKKPCNRMECGACTVLIDGVPHESCTYLALRAAGHTIVTSEITTGDPVVNALQQAWVTSDGAQCGYCSSGFVMSAAALLKQNSSPSVSDIKEALSGNLCRCGSYLNIISAVQLAATNLGGA